MTTPNFVTTSFTNAQPSSSALGQLGMAAKGVVPGSPQAKAMQMERYMRTIRDIPALPEIVNKINEKLGNPSTTAADVAKLIAYDPGLTSRVLRMVNSAAFGVARQISSIQHAIMILGFNATRGVVLSSSIFKLFEGDGNVNKDRLRDFWEHSLLCALATRIITEFYELPLGPDIQPEDAFSAAMLHDIGSLVLDGVAEKMHLDTSIYTQPGDNLMAKSMRGDLSLSEEERIYGLSHSDIGQLLAQKWKLPVSLTEVILYHHHPEKAKMSEDMVYWVALANQLAECYTQKKILDTLPKAPGASLFPQSYNLLERFSKSLLEHYPLDDERLNAMLERLAEEEKVAGDWLKLFDN
jgi:HD-like signal output (HDOD) protein